MFGSIIVIDSLAHFLLTSGHILRFLETVAMFTGKLGCFWHFIFFFPFFFNCSQMNAAAKGNVFSLLFTFCNSFCSRPLSLNEILALWNLILQCTFPRTFYIPGGKLII